MLVFPAIDLKEGKAVRLLQGRMEDSTVYAENPLEVAQRFWAEGAEYLHMVDLDGAFAGKPVNDAVIRKIVENVALKVQVGGGIRTLARIEELLNLGVARVILGTIAVRDPQLVAEAVQRYGDQIIIGIDAKNGQVAVQGWAETTEMTASELALKMKDMGVQRIIFTDISRDGMLQGPNIESTVQLAQVSQLKIIASGGVSSLEDLQKLQEQAASGVSIEGAIVGKALYSEAFTLAEALKTVEN